MASYAITRIFNLLIRYFANFFFAVHKTWICYVFRRPTRCSSK